MSKSIAEALIERLLDSIFDAKLVGKIGERRTEKELKLVKLLGRDGMILRNIYIPKENGETSEIDVMFICQKGIIVIESKNYSGWIFGNEKDLYWTASLSNGTKNRFYNPISQNRNHIKWLANYLGEEIPLFSMVVFSERCELKNVTVLRSDVLVVKRDHVYASVRKIWNNSSDALSDDQIRLLYDRLSVLTNVDEATKQAHIDRINQNYKNINSMGIPHRNTDNDVSSDSNICPLCGGQLVLRTAKKGANTGNKFWGCSNYPKCKYIKALSDPKHG